MDTQTPEATPGADGEAPPATTPEQAAVDQTATPPTPETPPADGADAFEPPEWLPEPFRAESAEDVKKLLTQAADAEKRAEGLRKKLSEKQGAPDKPEDYTFDPPENLAKYFDDSDETKAVMDHARKAAHKVGLSTDQFGKFIAETYGPMAEAGLLPPAFDPKAELEQLAKVTGLDAKGVTERITASSSFAARLSEQLGNGLDDENRGMIKAGLESLTDTAAGLYTLTLLESQLAKAGTIKVGGEGKDNGLLTKEDLKTLSMDPRIDPKNRDHADPQQRFDPALRKRYDAAYTRLYPSSDQ